MLRSLSWIRILWYHESESIGSYPMDTFIKGTPGPPLKEQLQIQKRKNYIVKDPPRVHNYRTLYRWQFCYRQRHFSPILIYSSAWRCSPGISFQSESDAEELSSLNFSEIGVFSVSGETSNFSFFFWRYVIQFFSFFKSLISLCKWIMGFFYCSNIFFILSCPLFSDLISTFGGGKPELLGFVSAISIVLLESVIWMTYSLFFLDSKELRSLSWSCLHQQPPQSQ